MMTMEKTIRWGAPGAGLHLLGLASCRRNAQAVAQAGSSAARPHGELISASPVPPTAPAVETSTNDPSKRKHPKPPSVQRRMVLAELVVLGQSNSDNASLPSGTVGTAADLAKTNLPSITSLAVPRLAHSRIPQHHLQRPVRLRFCTDTGHGRRERPCRRSGRRWRRAQIPASVRSLDGGKVVIEGFLLPVKMNNGLAVEFLLMRNQSMCCYGVPPKINEWITVQVNGEGVKPVMDQPIAVAGVLHVGPILENGSLAGIYRLEAEKISAPF